MRKFTVLLAVASLLAAGGCVSVRMDYAMDAAGGLTAAWGVEARRPAQGGGALLEEGMTFARDQMSLLASQWESRGIATETVATDGAAGVTGRREFSGEPAKAFAELERWMKEDGLTPFSAVTANHISKGGVEEYFLDATLDWKDLVAPSSLDGAPADLRAAAKAIETGCEITVSLSLPGRAEEHAGELSEAGGISTCAVKAAPGKPARIMLHTRVEKAFSAEAATATPAALERWGLVGICGLAGLLMLIIAIRCIVKMARYRGY